MYTIFANKNYRKKNRKKKRRENVGYLGNHFSLLDLLYLSTDKVENKKFDKLEKK